MTTSNITQQKYTVTVNEGDTTVVTVKAVGPQGADGTLAAGDIGDLTVSVAGNGAQSAVINSGAVTSDKILDGTIVNADINASASIDGSKISPAFTSDISITEGNPKLSFIDSDARDYDILVDSGTFNIRDITASNATRFQIASDGHVNILRRLDALGGIAVTGNITVTGTVDGVDIAARNTLFGGLTSSSGVLTDGVTGTTQSATDDSTKIATTAFVKTAVSNLVNEAPNTLDTLKELSDALGADANFSTTVTNLIADKLPLAGGTLTGNLTVSGTTPFINFTDSDDNPDFQLNVYQGEFHIKDTTNNVDRFRINNDGHIDITGNLDVGAGLDVTGEITGTSHIDLPDDAFLKLGNSDDFQIFHQSSNSNSIIKETGGGVLSLQTNGSEIAFFDSANTVIMAQFNTGGSCHFKHGANTRLETTSTGISVTGDINATDNLRITSTNPKILLVDSDHDSDFTIGAAAGSFILRDATNNLTRFTINSSGAAEFLGNLDVAGNIDITDGTLIIDNDANSPNTNFGIAEALRIDDSGITHDRALNIYEYHKSGDRFFSLNFNLESTSNGSAYVYTQGLYAGSTMLQIGSADYRFFVDAQVSSGSTDAITPTERFRIDTGGARVTGAVTATAINVCHLKSDTTASVTSTAAVINFNQESTTDTNKFSHSGGEITVLTTGWYAVKANVTYQSAASSRRNTIKTEIQKNGTSITSAEKYTFIQSDIKPIATAFVNGSGSINKQNGGFSSITRTAEGRYTLNFTNAMADDDYQVFGQIVEGGNRDDIKIHVKDLQQTTSDFDVEIYEGDNASTADTYRDRKFYVQVLDTNTAWGRYGQASIDTFVYLTANDIIRIRTQQIDEEGTTTILGASSEFFVKAVV